MRISDWSSDVCSSDLVHQRGQHRRDVAVAVGRIQGLSDAEDRHLARRRRDPLSDRAFPCRRLARSEEHTSELQSLMRISYAVFCLKKKKKKHDDTTNTKVHKRKHYKQHEINHP